MAPPGKADIAGCILAGGLSRRMGGGDKALMPLAGEPMISHVARRLAPQVGHLIINANGPPERFAPFGLPVVSDGIAGHPGPLAGVLAGLDWAARQAPELRYIATVSADAPLVPSDLVRRLAAPVDASRAEIAMASSGGKCHPVIALWPVALADDLRQALEAGTRKVLDWTDRHSVHEVDFADCTVGSATIDPFYNANTPDELAQLDAILAGGRP